MYIMLPTNQSSTPVNGYPSFEDFIQNTPRHVLRARLERVTYNSENLALQAELDRERKQHEQTRRELEQIKRELEREKRECDKYKNLYDELASHPESNGEKKLPDLRSKYEVQLRRSERLQTKLDNKI